jgi:hypothetical protein
MEGIKKVSDKVNELKKVYDLTHKEAFNIAIEIWKAESLDTIAESLIKIVEAIKE